jgi:hypothetical protein
MNRPLETAWERRHSALTHARAITSLSLVPPLIAGLAACGGYGDLPIVKPFHHVSLKAGQRKRFNGGEVAAGTIIHCQDVGSVTVPPRGTHVIVKGIRVNDDQRGVVSASCPRA